MAYLIDRNGAAVTRKEIAAILFEDGCYTRATQDYLTKIVAETVNTLREYGAENLLVKKRNSYAVDVSLFSCDAYDYLKGNPNAINLFWGEYMTQYGWSEFSLGRFYE